MKLIDILVDAGDETPLFGVHTKYLAMDPDGRVHGYCEIPSPTALGWGIPDALYSTDGRGCLIQIDRDDVDGQWQSAIITREQYEAALSAKNEGWIEWGGGECPVEEGVLVDVKYRDGAIKKGLRALIPNSGRSASRLFWIKDNLPTDIIAYRLHKPTKSEQVRADAWNAYAGITESDAESDLNECIGQDVALVWSGDGLPPVGCEVEYITGILGKPDADDNKPENGQIVRVVAHAKYEDTGNDVVVATWLNGNGGMRASVFSHKCLQPIRSEADKKRDEAVTAMLSVFGSNAATGTTAALKAIYDAIAAGKIPGVRLED